MRLRDKVAIIVGGGQVPGEGLGNGRAASILFAREGAKVVVADRNIESAQETVALVEKEGGVAFAVRADITVDADCKALAEACVARFQRIDILHNNVGITRMGSVVEMSEDDWQKVIDTNLTGVFLTCKHVIPLMLAQQCGAIVNISSLASEQVNSYPYMPYYAAKAGLNHLTRALAVQYAAQGIRANAVLPGVMNTPLIHQQIAGRFASTEEMICTRNAASPMARMGDAWDVAYASLFLASDEANYITGVCLPVDGGKRCAGR